MCIGAQGHIGADRRIFNPLHQLVTRGVFAQLDKAVFNDGNHCAVVQGNKIYR